MSHDYPPSTPGRLDLIAKSGQMRSNPALSGKCWLKLGSRIMDRRGQTMFRGPLRVLFAALCASMTVLPLWAPGSGAAAPASQLPDGVWSVQGRAIQGTRRCGDWMVRLTNRQGQLSGVVSLARSSVPIQNLVLMPDGSFSGTTQAGLTGSRHARAYKITGRFSGDTVSLTLEDNMCPPRRGEAIRHAAAR